MWLTLAPHRTFPGITLWSPTSIHLFHLSNSTVYNTKNFIHYFQILTPLPPPLSHLPPPTCNHYVRPLCGRHLGHMELFQVSRCDHPPPSTSFTSQTPKY